jgi:hypothetical protein
VFECQREAEPRRVRQLRLVLGFVRYCLRVPGDGFSAHMLHLAHLEFMKVSVWHVTLGREGGEKIEAAIPCDSEITGCARPAGARLAPLATTVTDGVS